MDYKSVIDSLSPDLVSRLRQGVETGRWPDGTTLTPEQREHSLQAIIAWEQKNLPQEHRVGFIDKGSKGKVAPSVTEPRSDTLRWVKTDDEGDQ